MRSIVSILLMLCCLAAPAAASESLRLEQFTFDATFAPPHNEPVVGDRVARYRVQLAGDVRWWRFQWEPKLTAWGVNQWRSGATIGNGGDAWDNSDYSVDKWRVSHTQNLNVWVTDHLALTTEYYMPIDRKDWGGHGLESNYYWLVGFRWRLK